MAAIEAAFPGGEVDEVEAEYEGGVKLYEVELELDGRELEITVSPDGIIVEVETELAEGDVPELVAATIARVAGGATAVEVEREETRTDAKLAKLQKPRVIYEVEFVKDGKKREVEIAADGAVIGEEEENEDDDD